FFFGHVRLRPHYSVVDVLSQIAGADDRNRTGDLVLTKDALCQLSYIGENNSVESLSAIARFRGRPRDGSWSGRRASNPRPTAWKAVTLPLSYSRLRAARLGACSALRPARPAAPICFLPSPRPRSTGLPTVAPKKRRLVGRGGFEPP